MVWASNMEICHDFVDKNIETAEKFHWFGFVGNLRLKLSGSNVKKKGGLVSIIPIIKVSDGCWGFLVIDFSHLIYIPLGYLTIFAIAIV